MVELILHLIMIMPTIVIGLLVAWCLLKVELPPWLDFSVTVASAIILGNLVWSFL